jgi:hypothetical protein
MLAVFVFPSVEGNFAVATAGGPTRIGAARAAVLRSAIFAYSGKGFPIFVNLRGCLKERGFHEVTSGKQLGEEVEQNFYQNGQGVLT